MIEGDTHAIQRRALEWLTSANGRVWLGFRRDVIISGIFAVVSAVIVGLLFFDDDPPASLRDWGRALWAIWTIAPPLYFMWEWANLEGGSDDGRFANMKYSHELCGKFWLAGIGVISVALLVHEPPSVKLEGPPAATAARHTGG